MSEVVSEGTKPTPAMMVESKIRQIPESKLLDRDTVVDMFLDLWVSFNEEETPSVN